MSESKEEMQDRFNKEFENIWPGDFLNYFKEKILPKVIPRTSGQGTFSIFQGENSTQGKAENSTKERLKIPSKESDDEIVMLCKATLF